MSTLLDHPASDRMLAVVATVPALIDIAAMEQGWRSAVAAAAVVLPAVPLALAGRRAPVPVFWWALAVTVAGAFAGVAVQAETSIWTPLPLATAVLLLARHVPARSALAVVVSGLAVGAAAALANAVLAPAGFRGGPELLLWAVGLAAAWAVGAQLRAVEVELALASARAARDLADAVRAERLRIAGDLHDVTGHHITQLVVRTEALRARSAQLPRWAADELTELAGDGRRAMADLRATLRLVRDGEATGAAAPLPGWSDIETLIDRVRSAGLPLRATLDPRGSALDAATTLTAYRVVQEGLTNVRKHAPGAAASVEVGVGPGVLTVAVENDRPVTAPEADAPGIGVQGLRERVAALGGTVTAGPTADGGYRLHATLPHPEGCE